MSIPKIMKAIAIAKPGDFDVIEKMEIPVPTTQPDEILIQVKHAGVNFIDVYYRKGLYPAKSFPAVLGTECSGIIVALPTDDSVLNCEEYKKRNFKLGDKVSGYQMGCFSEYAAVPWSTTFPIPDNVSFATAAAAVAQGLTVVSFMTEAYNVQRGDTVLVHAVAGGLGLLFTQYAKSRGARVIGTTSTADKATIARDNGADEVILYRSENTVDRVLELTKGEGVDAVFDGVGKDTFDSNFTMLKRKGTLVSVGNASGPVPPMPPLKLMSKNLKLVRPTMGNYIGTPEESRIYSTEVISLVSEGKLKIKIYNEYPFTPEGITQSQIDLTSGKTTGKLIIKISD